MIEPIVDWFAAHKAILWWLGILSPLTLIATVALLPYVLTRIHSHYFVRERRERAYLMGAHPLLRFAFLAAKNLLGVLFVLAGIAMLFLPGQGLVTIFVGIMLTNFPGKHALERWLVCRPGVLHAINWIRRKVGHGPLHPPGAVVDDDPHED